jgi:hypothetical protein
VDGDRAKLIKTAASYPEVARIFVHPPIKAELCKWAKGDRSWLAKVRPYFNHTYHFHIRMKCPPGFAGCKNQAPAAPKDVTGCGTELAYWMGPIPWTPKKRDPKAKPIKPAPALTSQVPAECRAVVTAPDRRKASGLSLSAFHVQTSLQANDKILLLFIQYKLAFAARRRRLWWHGTSPLYAMREARPVGMRVVTASGCSGVVFFCLGLILASGWTIIILLMRADNRPAHSSPLFSSKPFEEKAGWFCAWHHRCAFFFGCDYLTLSVLSAIEGLTVINPKFEPVVVP